jgi:hypothetical protein
MEKDRGSIWAYVSSLGRWGWAVLITFLLSLAGLVADAGFGKSLHQMPIWVWLLLILTTLIAAPFFAFDGLFHLHKKVVTDSEAKIRELEAKLRECEALPQLEIVFGNEPWNRQNDAGRILFRVGIQLRPGAPYPVSDVSLKIKHLSPIYSGATAQAIWTCKRALQTRLTSMHYSADKFRVSVPPACEALDVLKIGIPNSAEPITLYHNVQLGPLDILPQGAYEITLLASGGRSLPCEMHFVFGVTSTGKSIFKPDARFRKQAILAADDGHPIDEVHDQRTVPDRLTAS